MKKTGDNYAFIDSQNVNLSIRAQGWKLDWRRFRIFLAEKHGVSRAYIFIGYIEGNNNLYVTLQEAGFLCIFKPTLEYKDGTTKGNVDAELVMNAMIEYSNFDKAVIVTGDGDFYCLAKYFIEQGKFAALLIPNRARFSALLRFKIFRPFLRFMNESKDLLSYRETGEKGNGKRRVPRKSEGGKRVPQDKKREKKRPHRDGTL